jgi:RimJ/RimL family protein N-acetyltransferase
MTDRELLRLHLEAVWGITLPPLEADKHELVLSESLPPWSFYLAVFAQEQVIVRRAEVEPAQLQQFQHQARAVAAGAALPSGMRREVAFGSPTISPQQQALAGQVARILTEADADLINGLWPGEAPLMLQPQTAPCIGVVVGGRLMSIAHSSRQTAEACELGIDTIPEARRRGYAAAATILWTALVQQKGLVPIYSAFAWNTASLHLARSIGYVPRIEGVYGPVTDATQ